MIELGRFLVMQQLFSEEEVSNGLETVRHLNKSLKGQALAASLLDKLCRQDAVQGRSSDFRID